MDVVVPGYGGSWMYNSGAIKTPIFLVILNFAKWFLPHARRKLLLLPENTHHDVLPLLLLEVSIEYMLYLCVC